MNTSCKPLGACRQGHSSRQLAGVGEKSEGLLCGQVTAGLCARLHVRHAPCIKKIRLMLLLLLHNIGNACHCLVVGVGYCSEQPLVCKMSRLIVKLTSSCCRVSFGLFLIAFLGLTICCSKGSISS